MSFINYFLFQFKSAKYNYYVFISFLFIAFIVYWYGIIDVPRRDHLAFIYERTLFKNDDWSWFWHVVSYNQTRLNAPGDYFLFRPAHMAVLACNEIFFHFHPLLSGLLSICVHACAALSITFFVIPLLGRLLGIAIGLLFLVNFPGLELVLWRHISSYTFALIFFIYSIHYYYKKSGELHNNLKYCMLPILCFAMGGLFHEIVSYTLLIAVIFFGGLIILPHTFDKDSLKRLKNIFLICSLSLGFILVLNIFCLFNNHKKIKKNNKSFYSSFAYFAGLPISK